MRKQKTFTLSIVICTYNGEETLPYCLKNANEQNYPKNKMEILVVDNASTDNTKDITQNFIKKSKFKCRYIFEPKLGLSVARNRGIREAKGEIVAFIDDDAVANKNWVKNLSNCFKRKNVWAVGGRIIPRFKAEPPSWLPSKKYLFPIVLYDLGAKIKKVPHIMGANMAFAKKNFKRLGMFRIDLGMKGDGLVGGEEIEFCERVTRVGGKVVYNPKAIVYHLTPKVRLTKRYFSKRMFMQGVAWARIDKGKTSLKARLFRTGFRKPKNSLIALLCFAIFTLTKNRKKSFSNWCEFLLNLGYIYENYRSLV